VVRERRWRASFGVCSIGGESFTSRPNGLSTGMKNRFMLGSTQWHPPHPGGTRTSSMRVAQENLTIIEPWLY
jgi:hypothetical protein